MAIDGYSLCPGGTGKKIKFCCGDFLPELQEIDRMMEGEQYLACLDRINQLLEKEPRACLLASKCLLLRVTGQHEAARETAAFFREKHPDNQVAMAEQSMLAGAQDVRAGLSLILGAIGAAQGNIMPRTYQAMGANAGMLMRTGLTMPARALLQLQCAMTEDDARPRELLAMLCQAPDVPLILRDSAPPISCPEDSPWRAKLIEAAEAVGIGDWRTAEARLTALTVEAPQATAAWRNLATLRGWLANEAGCIEALRKYAALRAEEAGGYDDAVEAEAEALFISGNPLGDSLEMLRLEWTVKDVDRLQESLLSSPLLQAIPFDPARFGDGETPPPKAAFVLIDRPMPASAEGLTVESIPRMLGQALLFGRQTDREARLNVWGVAGDDAEAVRDLIAKTAGDAIEPESKKDSDENWSMSQKVLRPAWRMPRDVAPEKVRELLEQQRRDAVLKDWPNVKLGALDGLTAREAAKDGKHQIRLAAVLMVLEHLLEQMPGEKHLAELRTELGLPARTTIELKAGEIEQLPVVRFDRLNVKSLSDDDLIEGYWRAGAFAMQAVMRKFAEELISRPSLADSNDRIHAYATLARTEENISRAREWIAEGRKASEAKKESSASWDLMELSLLFAAHDGREAIRMLEHIQQQHLGEPGVGEALTQMLVDVGLLRPDGTPTMTPDQAAAAAAPAAEPGGLWTPDSGQTGGGGGGKLWTPE